jgi:hypothetical protein
MKAGTNRKTSTTILLALAVASIAVAGAVARPSQQVAAPDTLAQIQHPRSVPDFDTYGFVQPTGVDEMHAREAMAVGAGFAWTSAAIGGGFVLGLCLVAAAAAMRSIRSGTESVTTSSGPQDRELDLSASSQSPLTGETDLRDKAVARGGRGKQGEET